MTTRAKSVAINLSSVSSQEQKTDTKTFGVDSRPDAACAEELGNCHSECGATKSKNCRCLRFLWIAVLTTPWWVI